jgi:hypothetical protein
MVVQVVSDRGAASWRTEVLQAQFRQEGGRQQCGIEGDGDSVEEGGVKGGGAEVGQADRVKPKELHN